MMGFESVVVAGTIVNKRRFDGLQSLRALAALLVVAAHLKLAMPYCDYFFIKSAIGAIGVDIFFVISGFVIAMTSDRAEIDWKFFLKNRISRVVPIYYLISLPFLFLNIRHHSLSLSKLWNTIMFIPVLDLSVFTNPVHACGWTLCFEMWFYVSYALFLGMGGKRVQWLFLLFFLVGVTVSYYLHEPPFVLRFLFNPLVLEFCAGIIVYNLKRRLTLPVAWISIALFFVLVTLGLSRDYLGYHDKILASPPLGLERFLFWGLAAICLVVFVLALDQYSKFQWPRFCVNMGDASYALYLIQPYGLFMVKSWLAKYPTTPGVLTGLFFVAFSILASLAIHRGIEMRLTGCVKRMLGISFGVGRNS